MLTQPKTTVPGRGPQPAAVKTANILSKEREKAERSECLRMESSVKQQIFQKTMPDLLYSESNTQYHICTNCGEKFLIKSCYDFHIERKSVKIIFLCRVCNVTYTLFNRCKLLSHMLSHASSSLSYKLSDIKVYPLLEKQNSGSSDLLQSDATAVSHSSTHNLMSSDTDSNANSRTNTTSLSTVNNVRDCSLLNTCVVNDENIINVDNVLSQSTVNGTPESTDNLNKNDSVNNICNSSESSDNLNKNDSVNNICNSSAGKVCETPLKILNYQNHKCSECTLSFPSTAYKSELFLHFNKKIRLYTCKECALNMPNACSFKSHLRLHYNTPPYICPDCGLEFANSYDLIFHATHICVHLTQKVNAACVFPSCKAVLNISEVLQHIKQNHVKYVYKCKLCIFASYTRSGSKAHHDVAHVGILNKDTDLYNQCALCLSLLISPSRLENHLQQHFPTNGFLVFVCPGCNISLPHKSNLELHINNCIEYKHALTQSRKHMTSANSLTESNSEDSLSEKCNQSLPIDIYEVLKKCSFCNKSFSLKTSRDFTTFCFNCPSCNNLTTDVLGDSVDKSTNNEIVENAATNAVLIDNHVIYNNNELFIESNDDQGKIHKSYRCHLCKSIVDMDFPNVQDHFLMNHKEFNFLNAKIVLTRLEDEYGIFDLVCNSLVTQFQHLHDNDLNTDFNKNDNPNILNKNKHISNEVLAYFKSLYFKGKKKRKPSRKRRSCENPTPFTSGILISQDNHCDVNTFHCAKCDFNSSEKLEFEKHIIAHRDVSTAYQCMECGSSFTVKPSFATHLFVSHQINNVEDYIVENNCFDEQAVKQFEEDLNQPVRVLKEWSVDKLQCHICLDKFNNQSDFNKHFRVHGMAFLMKKKKTE